MRQHNIKLRNYENDKSKSPKKSRAPSTGRASLVVRRLSQDKKVMVKIQPSRKKRVGAVSKISAVNEEPMSASMLLLKEVADAINLPQMVQQLHHPSSQLSINNLSHEMR